jgi:hypothetical protein
MWIIKYVNCLIRRHIFETIQVDNSLYHYCLRCGKTEPQKIPVTVYREED